MRKIIIVLDPSYAKSNGMAYTIDDGPICFCSIPLEKIDKNLKTRNLNNIAITIFNSICKILSLTKKDSITLAVEGQFLGRNPAVFKGLVEIRSFFQGYFLAKFPKTNTMTIDPRKWQGSILNAFKMKSEEIKKRSIQKASYITGKTPNEDEADAVCILQYVMNIKG